ncbi:MAG: hypothetical protein OXH03_10290 [Bacteroidetes bacterium]|nr:hypothetical protein [Bacteroidota bacterium]MDE2673350.1 hypothetical protein [Bacteroidota bacterium]
MGIGTFEILVVFAIGGIFVVSLLVMLRKYQGRNNSRSDEIVLQEFYARLEATESEQDAIKRRVENLEAIATMSGRSGESRQGGEESVRSFSVRAS